MVAQNLGIARSSLCRRPQPHRLAPHDPLLPELEALCARHPRFGYCRITSRRTDYQKPEQDAYIERFLGSLKDLPPMVVADLMRRSWVACRHRLAYLRADGSGPTGALVGHSSKRR